MIAAADINIRRTNNSKLLSLDLEKLSFGRYFTDHMLEVDYEDGMWNNAEIKPYQPLLMDPAMACIHYGQSIFEGIKAYHDQAGDILIFRPYENFKRFNISAERMCMPAIPEEIFIEGMRQLIDIDRNWLPKKKDHALYIRPFMFSTDPFIGVRPSERYKFMIILSPTGPYYNKPMRIYVEEKYTRAAPGGIGYAKAAANYGASMLPTNKAKILGYDQVLWTDAFEHKYVQEIGTMNVFFVIDGKVYTPGLGEETILAGITRDSAISILKQMGLPVQEAKISIDEVILAHQNGLLQEVFGAGTAATIASIKELRYKDYVIEFDVESWTVAPALKQNLDDIREGRTPDENGWMFRI